MGASQSRRAAIKKLKLLVYSSRSDVENFRAKIEQTYCAPFLPNHVERSERSYGSVMCDVLSPEIYSSRRVMLYVHGGSFVGGSRASWREFCALLANRTYSRVVLPEYRLAPAHAFPAAIEDVQTVFHNLFTEEQIMQSLESPSAPQDGNAAPDMPELLIGADGAGATIALALLLNLRERYRRCIRRVVLFSPWLNLSEKSPLLSGRKVCDEVMSGDCLQSSGAVYTYASNLENPLVSPLYAQPEMLSAFPPVYIQMGGKEILLDDAKKFCSLLRENGGECALDVWPDMMHLFQMADEYLDEAHDAMDRVGLVLSGGKRETDRQRFDNKPVLERGIRSEA